MSPLTRPQFHYDWHWFWETGNGELGNNNIHSLDICRWGLGLAGLPKAVLSYGGRLGYIDAGQTPNTQVVVFDFGDKTIVSETRGLKTAPFRPGFEGGWIFEGTNGFIAGTSLFDPDGKLVSTFSGNNESHFANFLNAVRSRKREQLNAEDSWKPICPARFVTWATSPGALATRFPRLNSGRNCPKRRYMRTCRNLRPNRAALAGQSTGFRTDQANTGPASGLRFGSGSLCQLASGRCSPEP